MAEQDKHISDAELRGMLKQIEADVPAPSDDLMARVMADAERLRPVPGARIAGAAPSEGFFEGLVALLGGWKGAGGLVTAGVVGLWIGTSPPATIEAATADFFDVISPDLTGGWSTYEDLL